MKKIGAVRLTGMITGQVLGSGIIIIPPLVYATAGEWSFVAWLLVLLCGVFFAFLFSFLSIEYPGEAGVANAIESVFGERGKLLSGYFLFLDSMIGPVAVLLIAAQYGNFLNVPDELFAFGLLLVNLTLLLMQITTFGTVATVLVFGSAGALLVGGSASFFASPVHIEPLPQMDIPSFGTALLLLFWVITGWEVAGSYTAEVSDMRRTFITAAVASVIAITATDLVIAAGVQYTEAGRAYGVAGLLTPLFGSAASGILRVITVAMCLSTALAFVGSIARLSASVAQDGNLPRFLAKRNRNNAPMGALLFIAVVQTAVLWLHGSGAFTAKTMIAVADGFFIANALVGLAAAYVIFRRRWLKVCTMLLILVFAVILVFSHLWVLLVICGVVGYVLYRGSRTAPSVACAD